MKNHVPDQAAEYIKAHRKRKRWYRVITALAAMVVFCTVYALILPAITLEGKDKELDCPVSVHQHTADCYDTAGNLTCGQADYVVHVHNDDCKDEDGNMICQLPEILIHEHSDACYEKHEELVCSKEENEGHVHESDCYIRGQGELICGEENGEHIHDDKCYEWTDVLSCGMKEGEGAHQHTSDCYQMEAVTTCNKQEMHTHSDACYGENGALVCGLLELTEHVHGDGCFRTVESTGNESTDDESTKIENTENESTEIEKDGIRPMSETATDPTRLMEYAKTITDGKVTITVSKDDIVVQPDPDTNEYEIFAGETYNVGVAYSGKKIDPGKYYVTFTSVSNISLDQMGTLLLRANNQEITDVGSWYFQQNEDGTVWLIFDINDSVRKYSDIELIANVVCQFDYTDKPMDFDGTIKYHLKYNEDTPNTVVNKWASTTQDKPGKIKWGTEIYGNSQSNIAGNILTDTLTGGQHYYTEDDFNQGIKFEATRYDGNFDDKNNRKESHTWTVTKDTPGLTWTQDGWSYTMPETVWCTTCEETVTLGNDNWLYSFSYTSTIRGEDKAYRNTVSIDGRDGTGTLKVNTSGRIAQVVKTAEYKNQGTDTHDDDTIEWTIKATIPGAKEGKFDYCWHLWDVMQIDMAKTKAYCNNDLDQATVMATVNGKTFEVPEKSKATADDLICWKCVYSEEEGAVTTSREIDLYSRCNNCTEATCPRWENGKCRDENQGFCNCWNFTDDVELVFTYTTAAGSLIDSYGDKNAQVANSVQLNNVQYFPGETRPWQSVNADSDKASVPLSGVFSKERTDTPDEENDYKVEYTVTVNEVMEDLSSLQTLTIDDTMTSTLAFLPDTLKIYKENAAEGKVLVPSDQYTLAYQPNVENEKTGKMENLLKITLKSEALGAYKYTLVYQAKVSGGNANYTYSNTASIQLFAQTYDVGGTEYKVPDAAISGKNYGATLYKYDSDTKLPLKGAVFELYSVEDEQDRDKDKLIHTYETGSDGIIQVETDTIQNVYLKIHKLYYLKEKTAPQGYQLDNTMYYFWFCDNNEETSCSRSNEFGMPPYDGICIYTFQADPAIYDIQISNRPIQDGYELPKTGGHGTIPYIIGGLTLTGAGLLLLYNNRKRRKEDFASS